MSGFQLFMLRMERGKKTGVNIQISQDYPGDGTCRFLTDYFEMHKV